MKNKMIKSKNCHNIWARKRKTAYANVVCLTTVVLTFCVALIGCSTKRNTWLSRSYQRLSSHFNVYYNGTEAFNTGIDNIRARNKNDYSRVLPVYEFANIKNSSAAKNDMETALKKSHKLVQLHSITVKPDRKAGHETDEEKRFRAKEEFNPYVPEGYLLMGKANVVLHEEQEAIKYFDYLSRKHEGERPTYEAKIWEAIAYTQIGQYNNALVALRSYDKDGIAPANLYPEYQAAYANLYICQEKYAEAIPYMEKAAKEINDRHCRRRYSYILAQLYRTIGNKSKAAPLFLKLSKNIQDYEMSFAAKLDLATVATTPQELAKAEKSLRKMSSDPKYETEQDQVFYALGHLEKSKGNEEAAVGCFEASVKKSISNDNQKGLSFLALADIHQVKPRYIEASEALDSAAVLLDDANMRKKEANDRAKLLQPLAKELRTIRDNDSLLNIARMDANSRDELLEKMVKEDQKKRDAEKEAHEAEQQNAMTQSDFYQVLNNFGGVMGGNNAQSSWYFYNTQLVTAGKSTFRSRWGNRKNEDNWRRSDKSSTSMEMMGGNANEIGASPEETLEGEIKEALTEVSADAPLSIKKLLDGLPLTEEAQHKMEETTADAFIKSASLLYDDLRDYDSSTEQLLEMLRRYPQNKNRQDALALLHFAQQKAGDSEGMQRTDNEILRNYPDSKMAQYITHPGYLESEQARRKAAEDRYRSTYAAYLSNNFDNAIMASTTALNDTTTDVEHRPRYMLVRAMAHAKNGNVTDFKTDLMSICADYAGTAQDSTAKIFLAQLEKGMMPIKYSAYSSPLSARMGTVDESVPIDKADYSYAPDSAHLIVCVVDAGRRAEAQFMIADYNFSNYILQDYDLKMSTLPGQKEIIIIRSFKNKKEALVYFYALREQPFWKELTSDAIPQIFMISEQNFRLLGLTGIDEAFRQFIDEHYK